MSSVFKFQTKHSFVPNKNLLTGYTIYLIILSQSLLQLDHFLPWFFFFLNSTPKSPLHRFFLKFRVPTSIVFKIKREFISIYVIYLNQTH